MNLAGVFRQRFRGFRVVDLVALAVMLVLALASYAFKTLAQGMGADTLGVEDQIAQEDRRIHLLKAEIAHLEDPDRIERLSGQYLGMQAVDPKQEVAADALSQVALKVSQPAVPVAPKPAATADAVSQAEPKDPQPVAVAAPKPVTGQ